MYRSERPDRLAVLDGDERGRLWIIINHPKMTSIGRREKRDEGTKRCAQDTATLYASFGQQRDEVMQD